MVLKGKTALVTGGAHRVGKAIALALAERGCGVVIHYHASEDAAKETVDEIRSLGVRTERFQADLRRMAELKALFQAVDELGWGLDVLVNSAAVMERVDLRQASEQDWARTIDLNLKATFFATQQAARRMSVTGGVVVNISDVAGLQAWKRFPIHSVSKAGVEMLTKTSALALAPDIRVNAIAPGPVRKPAGMSDARWREIGGELPLGRPGSAEDVARAVVFLCENAFITGETLVVDGGLSLR
jgi:NAD(P)-dependent dehydrogenase (short-subunit alcohol dehydrogenase family)